MKAYVFGLRALLSIGLCVLCGGCFGSMLKTRMADRFKAEFACDSTMVTSVMWPGGVRVDGCDQVAFYVCDPNSTCRLDHSRPMTEPERSVVAAREHVALAQFKAKESADAAERARVEESRHALDSEIVPARQLVATRPNELQPIATLDDEDSRIEVLGLPAPSTLVLWRFHTQRALSAPPCRPTISRDGELIRTEAITSHETHDADFLLTKSDYMSLGRAQHVRGVICGVSFDLDEAERRKLVPDNRPLTPGFKS